MRRDIYIGDNLDILRRYIPAESVDLVYLDPPFKSDRNYNLLFARNVGERAAAQQRVFEDTWGWTEDAELACALMMRTPGKLGEATAALFRLLGDVPMMAYIAMMAPRLLEIRRVLKPSGSVYLHCDPTASHYLKILLDAIFGPKAFRNEIIWRRTSAHSDARQGAQHYGRVHDTLLFYSRGERMTWSPRYVPHEEAYIRSHYPHRDNERRFGLWDITGPGGAAKGNPRYSIFGITKYWRYREERMHEKIKQGRVVQPRPGAVPREIRYLDESPGLPVGDVWTDIAPINSQAKERVGYPTQKPSALLKRIIEASTRPGDTVLDPFCGCGTAIVVADQIERQWIGIDITKVALEIIGRRLDEIGKPPANVPAIEARAYAEAVALAETDRKRFETWALGLVGYRPEEPHRGADRGMDSRFLDALGRPVVVSVKSGKVSVTHVRDLHGVVDREAAVVGALITLKRPTIQMLRAAKDAGLYETRSGPIARLQIMTVRELLERKTRRRIEYPPADAIFRPASRAAIQYRLPLLAVVPGSPQPDFPRQEVPTSMPSAEVLRAEERLAVAPSRRAQHSRARARRRSAS